MIVVVLLFIGFVVASQLVLTDAEIEQSATNVVFAMAEKLLPRPWSYLAVIAVILSTIGTLETSILQFSRTMYAKGRDGALHPRYAVLHKSWRTPWVATSVIVIIGLALLFFSSFFPTLGEILKVSVNSIAFQVACYYFLACVACIWRFRNEARHSVREFTFLLAWPALSAVFLIFIVIYSVPTFDTMTNIIGIGGIAIGIVPLLLNRWRARRVAA
jgi:amino acid transporter